MKYISTHIEEDKGYLIVISDIHIEEKTHYPRGHDKLIGYIEWVKNTPEARVFLNGDLLTVSTRQAKTSPYDVIDPHTSDFTDMLITLFAPIKSQIIGATVGNHEQRLIDYANIDLIKIICKSLDVPYCGYSAGLHISVGSRSISYKGYIHHTSTGAITSPGKLNAVKKLSEIVPGCDFYVGGHSHGLITSVEEFYAFDTRNKAMVPVKQVFIVGGSYLDWPGSYSEMRGYKPSKLGSVRIRFDGTKKDIHVSS